MAYLLRTGFLCQNIDPLCTELSRVPGEWRVRKGVVPMIREPDVGEAGLLNHCAELSFQESTSNSAGP